MALFGPVIWVCSITFLLLLQSFLLSVSAMKKTYIVRMDNDKKPDFYTTHEAWYSANLQTLMSSEPNTDSKIMYTYKNVYQGFAASLTADQAETLRQSEAVLGMYEDTFYTLHTTRTPEFLGLDTKPGPWAGHSPKELYKSSQNVIIGVLDTGVWPESKSFNDEGMSDVPHKWNDKLKQICRHETAKAIYGTHTASTAAGAIVQNASLYGYAAGNARGMAPGARLAIYKVCWGEGKCASSDISAGMDRAIDDGVDVLSLSLGGGSLPYYDDPIAIGGFAAMERGIVVSCSAGNSGPTRGSVTNVAPWIMTVGAGTLDRNFPALATLGDGSKFTGQSLYSGKGMGKKLVELVYKRGTKLSSLCIEGSLDPGAVKGKVVLCDRGINARVEKGAVVKAAGGVGMILANTAENGEELVADSHFLPAVGVGMTAGDLIRKYGTNTKNPTVVLSFGGTVVNVKPSPVVAAFSSRGPNSVTREILKPDLIGPGVNILAAWPDNVSPTGLKNDTRTTKFNIISGTSMSCPHISGLAALLKAAHPKWSPSAIKSALMTTAYTVANTNSPLRDAANNSHSTPYAHGSGYVDIRKALDPGLVYDATPDDYLSFVCSLNYKLDMIKLITQRKNVSCDKRFENPGQLNYPSFSVLFKYSKGKAKAVVLSRELTNVGLPRSIYTVKIEGPANVKVKVEPAKLVFEKVGDKKLYTVTFEPKSNEMIDAFGSIVWKNELHQVRSPVAFAWV
ncbi:hypothetical protein CASFOL_032396 [Castilleja foliolosa]|uniref:Subtilisin-like protease n=1 Tax=Castilleja foliolosa TaxID=1961234 RepID=A0ABD3C1C1_9LAMI